MKRFFALGPKGRLAAVVLWVLATAASLGFQIHRLPQLSNGFDEVAYIGQGRVHAREGDFGFSRRMHAPLFKMLSAVATAWAGVPLPSRDGKNPYQFGFDYLYRNALPAPYILLLSRLPMLLLPVLLGLVVFLWGSELGGAWSGLAMSVFLLFDVNIAAHSGLVMPDIALTTFLTLAAYAVWRAGEGGVGWRVAAGVFFGLACLSKTPALLALPVFAAALAATPRWGYRRWTGAAATTAWVAAMALAVVIIGYRVTGFPWWLRDMADRFAQTTPGRGVPFFGRHGIQTGADPLGYAMKIFFKCTPPFLFAVFWALWAARRLPLRMRVLGWGLVAVFVVPTLFSASQSAVRYVLPAFPFLLLLGSYLRGAREIAAAMLLVAAQGVVFLRAYPHFLAYTNAFYRSSGLPIFSGSELDFGQDLPSVRNFLRVQPGASAVLCYFGWADPRAYGIDAQLLPGYPVLMREAEPRVNPPSPTKEWLIVSVSSLQGHRDRDLLAPLIERGPDKRIAKTFWAWDITADRLTHVRLAAWYERYGWVRLADHERARAAEATP